MSSFGHNMEGSRDGGKFINYKLGPGEVLLVCPYETSHRVEKSRFGRHLAKCRENYKKAKGSTVDMRICRWNAFHHYPAPEIGYHEQTCMDASEIVTHIEMLNSLAEAKDSDTAPVVKNEVKHDPTADLGENWEEEVNINRAQNPRGYNPREKLKNSTGIIKTLPGITTKSEREAFRKEQYKQFVNSGENFQDPNFEEDNRQADRRKMIGFSVTSASGSEQQRYEETEDGSVSSSYYQTPSSPKFNKRQTEGYSAPGSSRQ